MGIRLRSAILPAALFLSAAASAWAQVPERISFQGRLTNASAQPVNGDVPMTFRLYTTATGGAPLWTETQTAACVNGVYTVSLGAVTPLTGVAFDTAYWLSV